MLERLPKFQRNVGLALVAVLIGWAAWTLRDVLNPLILGYQLAYILRPYVLVLEKRGLGRRTAVNIIFSAFAVVLTASGVGLIVQAQAIVENVLAPTPEGEDPIAVAEQRVDNSCQRRCAARLGGGVVSDLSRLIRLFVCCWSAGV